MRKLGLVATAGVLLGSALAIGLLRGRGREEAERDGLFAARPAEPGGVAPTLADPGPAIAVSSRAGDGVAGSTRQTQSDALPRGILRGRLVEAEGGAPLRAEKTVLLASPGCTVAETLRTGADGGFTSVLAFPRGSVRAWVSEPGTRDVLVRHEAEFDPHATGEWLVPVPRPPVPDLASGARPAGAEDGVALIGTVVDLEGKPVHLAQVKVFALGAGGALSCDEATRESGAFHIVDLAPGPHRVLVQGRFVSSAPLDLVLAEGPNDAGTIVLPAAPAASAVRGRLVKEEGGDDPFAVVLLRERASGKELAVLASDFHLRSENGSAAFEFAGVPAGEYELSIVSIDGREYLPATLRVSPPVDGLEFRSRAARPRSYVFHVRDAATGADVEDPVVAARVRGQWIPGDEDGFPFGFERWLAYAPGYRPARGDFSQARRGADGDDPEEEGERFLVEVALEPGYGLAVLCRDVESDRLLAPVLGELCGPPVEGVTVAGDGEPLARSDADGLALLALPRPPRSLACVHPGWRVVREREDDGVLYVHFVRE